MQETRVVKGDPKHDHGRTGRRWTGFLAHRWPTALGVAVAAMTAFDLRVDAGFVSSLSALIVVMALVYVGAAAMGRRRFSGSCFSPDCLWRSSSLRLWGSILR